MRAHRKSDDRNTKRDEQRFSSGVKARDDYRCRMERWSGKRRKWEEHGVPGSPDNPLFAAHIYDRNECGHVKFNELVGITSCLDCHDRYDLRSFKGPAVRVPLEREKAAFRLLAIAITNWRVARRKPPARPERAA